MKEKITKYTYGQFAKINGKRYRVRKSTFGSACQKCALSKGLFHMCSDPTCRCVDLIPLDAYFEKV